MSQSTVLLLSCEVSVGVLEELRAFGGGKKMEVWCIFFITFCEVCGIQLNFAESKSLFYNYNAYV